MSGPTAVLFILTLCVASSYAWVTNAPLQRVSTIFLHSTRKNDELENSWVDEDGNVINPFTAVADDPDLESEIGMIRTIAKAADGRKAETIVGLQVAHVTTVTCFMVFMSGNSRPQNQAIAAAIMEDMEEEYGIIQNPQGTADSGWMILDYGSIMVHIMTPKSRLYYNVEGQWRTKGGIEVDLSDVLVPNTVEEFSARGESSTMEGISADDDPFWQ